MARKHTRDELRTMIEEMLEMDPRPNPEVMIAVMERTGASSQDLQEAFFGLVLDHVGSPAEAVNQMVAQIEKRRRERQ